jgi:tetratricopeptide (TPR) repeat protein
MAAATARARAVAEADPRHWRAAVLHSGLSASAEAVALLERAHKRNPGEPYLEAALALAYEGAGQRRGAREIARRAVQRRPRDRYLLTTYLNCVPHGPCTAGLDAIHAIVTGQRDSAGALEALDRACVRRPGP